MNLFGSGIGNTELRYRYWLPDHYVRCDSAKAPGGFSIFGCGAGEFSSPGDNYFDHSHRLQDRQ